MASKENISCSRLAEFSCLLRSTVSFLNADALLRPDYYASRSGKPLEDDVVRALKACAIGTFFEGTIVKVSGQRFPDIVVKGTYGVEVKSTKGDHWTSTGSSILESTRVSGVERIFMVFGKLGGKPEFRTKPYEDCLYDIAVTHMPRYLINMNVDSEETIFSKMGTSYDVLSHMDNPISVVSKYYRDRLNPGESLWWVGDSADETAPMEMRLWRKIPCEMKLRYSAYGLVNYPEVFAGNYDAYSLWLASHGVIDSHIRDQFSAGGREIITLMNGRRREFPAVYRKVRTCRKLIIQRLCADNPLEFDIGNGSVSNSKLLHNRLAVWADKVSSYSAIGYDDSMCALRAIFAF